MADIIPGEWWVFTLAGGGARGELPAIGAFHIYEVGLRHANRVAVEFCVTGSYPVLGEGANTMTAKETVRALLEQLPDDCSLEDVQYHLYVVQALERGEADEQAGRTVPHEQVEAELRRKWLLGHGG